jgi:tetratricopeptide (TPR) repeat protein
LGRGQLPQTTQTYQTLATMGAVGASFAASGLGHLALYEGRLGDAVTILEKGAAADLAAKSPDKAAMKYASIAFAHLVGGRNGPAIDAAEKALASSQVVPVRFMAARILVEAGAIARAKTLAAGLVAELPAEPQAYGKIIEGDIALKNGDAREATKILNEANGLIDTWLGRFDLGRAYLEAGALVQADSEFDACLKRRGEALSLLVDEEATYGYFPVVYYYQGRVREGLKNAGFADSYRQYLKIRGASNEDPLLPEVRRRASS